VSKHLKFVTSYIKQLPGRAASRVSRSISSSSTWKALNKPLLQEESEPDFSSEEAVLADSDSEYEFAPESEPVARKSKASRLSPSPVHPPYSVFTPKPFSAFDALRTSRLAAEKEESSRIEAETQRADALNRKKLREESDRLLREYDKQMEADQREMERLEKLERQSEHSRLKHEKRLAKQKAYEAAPKTVTALVDEMLTERERLKAAHWTDKQIEEWGRLARLAARTRKGK
jgi:hypothetical protein